MDLNSWTCKILELKTIACFVLRTHVHDMPDVLVYGKKISLTLKGRKHRLVIGTHPFLFFIVTKNWDCGFSWLNHTQVRRVLENYFLARALLFYPNFYCWFKGCPRPDNVSFAVHSFIPKQTGVNLALTASLFGTCLRGRC